MEALQTRPWVIGSLLLAVALLVAAAVWWLLPGKSLSAQQVMEDACGDAEPLENVDSVVREYDPDGQIVARLIVEVNRSTGMSIRSYNYNTPDGGRSSAPNGELTEESVRLRRASSARSEPGQIVKYERNKEDGQWTEWRVSKSPAPTPEEGADLFCGYDLSYFTDFRYDGEERLDGVPTKKFTGTVAVLDETDQWELWIDTAGRQVKALRTILDTGDVTETVSSGWGETNVITAPVQGTPVPTPAPTGTPVPTPTPAPTVTPTPAATNTPIPTATLPPVTADAWLEPDPTGITFDGQWRQFALRGTGLERVDLAINVINYPDGPSSTGAVELESRRSLPSATDACRTTYYTGYAMSVDWTFSLVGCQAGTVIIRLSDPANDYALIREYTVTVSGGP